MNVDFPEKWLSFLLLLFAIVVSSIIFIYRLLCSYQLIASWKALKLSQTSANNWTDDGEE